jgi:branched-chain amino acid transport system substrate-binding protein
VKRIAIATVTIIALLALLVSGCAAPAPEPTPPPPPPPEDTPTPPPPEPTPVPEPTSYKLGFCSAATGGGASLGMPERNTAEMIAEQLEEAGGVVGPDGVTHPVEVIIYDTESTPDVGSTVVTRLIEEDEVDAIVCGTLSGNSLAMVPLVQEAEVPFVSMASARSIILNAETGESYEWAFKTPQENLHSGVWQALWARHMGWETVCDLYENTGYGQDCLVNTQAAMDEVEIEVVYTDSFERTDTEFPQMAGVTGAGCDALVIGSIPPGASMATVASREVAPDLPVVHGHGVCNQAFIDLAGEAAEGVVLPCGKLMYADLLPDDDPQKEFLLQYIDDYTEFTDGEPIDTFGGHAMDALSWVIEAMESLDEGLTLEERRTAIRDYIEAEITDWPGTGGVFNITPDDHLGLTYEALGFVKVENGTWVYFPPEDWAAAPEEAAAPDIPHPVEGQETCLVCHETGVAGATQIPSDHEGVAEDACTTCHQPAP